MNATKHTPTPEMLAAIAEDEGFRGIWNPSTDMRAAASSELADMCDEKDATISANVARIAELEAALREISDDGYNVETCEQIARAALANVTP